MHWHRNISSSTMKNNSNAVSQKENDNSPETKLKITEERALTDGEFNIAIMKKLNELQENSEKQFNELRNKVDEQRNTSQKRLVTLKKKQILELKNSIK